MAKRASKSNNDNLDFKNPHFIEENHYDPTELRVKLEESEGEAAMNRTVAKVDELMAFCNELTARLKATATARRQLLEATLREALSGQRERQREVLR